MLTISLEQAPKLSTERLVLRALEDTDANALFALRSNTISMQYIARPIAKTIEDIHQLLQVIKQMTTEKKSFWWAITLKEKEDLIGYIGIFNIDAQDAKAEIGYMLLPEYFAKGIMQEAISVVVPVGFKELGLHRIYAHIDPKNIASAKLLEKNNFLKEAHLREDLYFEGVFLDTVIYGKLATDA